MHKAYSAKIVFGIVVVVLACAFFLVACGSRINQDNFDKIQTGMTLAQVKVILGNPTESSSVDVAVFSGTVSKWKAGDVTITIQFVNGKVVAKQLAEGKE
jgi:outer membrane protein assembly factor BamE (lipoprotein component of BamABCDE complex)